MKNFNLTEFNYTIYLENTVFFSLIDIFDENNIFLSFIFTRKIPNKNLFHLY